MDDYISISTLNDFIFCPYSIYLHNVYMEADEGLYHASPQIHGKLAHASVDNKTYSTRQTDLVSLPVFSERLGFTGRIDIYKRDKYMLIERKYRLSQIFRGQLYQLWAQYYCLQEMGYKVDSIAFYEISSRKLIPIQLPGISERLELEAFIDRFRRFVPSEQIKVNPNKCIHCIYSCLCDKTSEENVYT